MLRIGQYARFAHIGAANMTIDPKYAPQAKEMAMSVDLAYVAMEQDIRAELDASDAPSRKALQRLLEKLRDRRAVMDQFKQIVGSPWSASL